VLTQEEQGRLKAYGISAPQHVAGLFKGWVHEKS